jgi:hypothetical protein
MPPSRLNLAEALWARCKAAPTRSRCVQVEKGGFPRTCALHVASLVAGACRNAGGVVLCYCAPFQPFQFTAFSVLARSSAVSNPRT